MKAKFALSAIIYAIIICLSANSFVFIQAFPLLLCVLVPIFLAVNIFAGLRNTPKKTRICRHGTYLLSAFCISLIFSAVMQMLVYFRFPVNASRTFLWSIFLCISVHFVVFWNGIIRVYLFSTQLGIKLRLIGILCGMIPIANLIALFFILKTTTGECLLEQKKYRLNAERKSQQICATKYPVLLVHGVFFRDFRFFNYWGRIPEELENNGAKIFYGNQPSAASVADCALYLKNRILEILSETGAKKVNIIAHSKGGLDCRYAIAKLGMAPYIASLTTINTPHRGCLFADYLLTNIPSAIKNKVAKTYNTALRKLGEEDADFLAAVNDLTESRCRARNAETPIPEGIYCQSIGSVLRTSQGGKFPLNFSYHLVKHFSGENDGLVSTDSFSWGENYTLMRTNYNRGISHGDMIDLNRENLPGFDVREFYVNLVQDLKARGL